MTLIIVFYLLKVTFNDILEFFCTQLTLNDADEATCLLQVTFNDNDLRNREDAEDFGKEKSADSYTGRC